uniref:Ig-like domain-containing protein n=1 Tax=Malurus cyaneus samueli TaxID=2593467 RepID=A0A8C5TXA8_9PASS
NGSAHDAHSPLVSTEHFKPTPLQNVLGIVGRDTILPCTISSTKPLENPQVQWGKITDGHTENIYTYMGQLGGESGQKYCGRTSMPGDGFATGNVSLTLKNVQPADEGIYSCTVISRDWRRAAFMETSPTNKLSCLSGTGEVFIEILGPKGRGLELGCRSHGWFPEPTVQWVTEYGQGLFADTEIHQDSRKLFSVWSRVTWVLKFGGNVEYCHMTLKNICFLFKDAVCRHVSLCLPFLWTLLTLLLLTLAAGAVLAFKGKSSWLSGPHVFGSRAMGGQSL